MPEPSPPGSDAAVVGDGGVPSSGLPPPPAGPSPWSVADVLALVRSAPARLGPWAAPAATVIALVVLVALVWGAYRAGSGGGPPVEASLPRVGSAGDPSASSAPASSTRASATTTSPPVVAHVAGAVVRAGLYALSTGARVADALAAAGGPAADADVDAINLAAPVADGERVYVPRKGEVPPTATVSAGAAVGAGGQVAAIVDLNKATADELDDLPGVGPSTAAAIVAYRAEHGRFRTVDELLEVRGIGPAKLATLRPKVRVR